KLPAQFYIL
nr:Chain P, KLPAQFYIL peptide [synthetic construct]3KYO_Q Chain Q, KLPAQFYIL peptide [synthetic construct]